MTTRRELSPRPAGSRISHGMSQEAERQAQQRQSRQPEDGSKLAYDPYGRLTVVPADGVQLLGMTFASAPSAADAQALADKSDELISKLTDGGFLDEDVGTQGGSTAAADTSISVATINATSSLQRQGVEVGYLRIEMYSYVTPAGHVLPSTIQWTSVANDDFPRGTSSGRYRFAVDLRRYDEVRFSFYVAGATLLGGTLALKYATTIAGSTSGQDIASTAPTLATSGSPGYRDTGWIDMESGAQVDGLYITPVVADSPTLVNGTELVRITAEFRAKTP